MLCSSSQVISASPHSHKFDMSSQVGLFAGIVSGFIIDARGDIQSDSEKNLLSGIWSALRQPTVPTEDVVIPSSSKWIYVLWLLSLQLTLFSAIMGVLARGWLEQFAPAVIIRPAEEACRRYRLDRQVALWHVDSVITLIPLFVQIASFLFLVGLILRCFSDDGVIGYIVLAISAAGGLLYVLISLLHVLIPSSPFHTPLSLLVGLPCSRLEWVSRHIQRRTLRKSYPDHAPRSSLRRLFARRSPHVPLHSRNVPTYHIPGCLR